LYEAANVMLTRYNGSLKLKDWAFAIAKRSTMRKARIALARRLSDNGSIFAAHKTIEIAVALNLVPCFTPVESPESNGMAEAFVKTLKRDYVRVSPIPDAAAALTLLDGWIEDYNTVHPHSRLGYA
jgi:transposase InsO family protein